MTIDKEKLKVLAQAATGGIWQCEKDTHGRLHVTAGEFLDIAEVGYQSALNPEADAQFIAAARPEVILALLAEIERLEADNSSMRGSTKRMGEDASKMQKQLRKAQREIDQLKADNEHLRNGMGAIRSVAGVGSEPLVPHIADLRKDAERYRFVRKSWAPSMAPDEANAQIDAAMTKEASHG